MIEHRWQLWLLGWAVSAALLAMLFLWQRRTRDATAVDAGWGASLVLCSILYAALAPGSLVQRLAIALPVGLENLRIASLVRNRLGKGEDSRYRELRRRWREKGREQPTFAIFYQAQAFLAAILSVPALLASFNRERLACRRCSGSASRSGSWPRRSSGLPTASSPPSRRPVRAA